MNKTTKHALQFLIASFLIALICAFIFFFFYDSRQLNEEYRQIKSLARALVLRESIIHTLKILPSIVIFLYVLCFSVLFTLKPFQTDDFTYGSVAHPAYILLILLLIFIISSSLLIIPRLTKEKAEINQKLRVARETKSYARKLYTEGRYTKTLSVIDIYLQIDDSDQEMINLYNETVKFIEESASIAARGKKETPVTGKSAETSLEKGKRAYENEDYYTALFYFERALDLHRDNEELKELYRSTKARITGSLGRITREEEQKKRLIEQKERAIAYLKKEQYYEAYEIFSSLHNKYPEMKDLSLYLDTVTAELKKVDFVTSELREAEWLPSVGNLVFIDRNGYVNTVERVVPFMGNFYFYTIKRSKMPGLKPSVVSWKYGKWLDGYIRLKNEEGFKKLAEKERERSYIVPFVEPGYLVYTGQRDTLLDMLNVYERFSLAAKLRESGFDIQNTGHYIAATLGQLFSVYVLSLFLSALAWAKRSIYEFPPLIKLVLFVLVVPLLCHFLRLLYVDMNSLFMYSHRYFARLFSGTSGMNIAVFIGIINGVFAVIATLYFLSQSSRVE
jgi:tetratricopeptide (TPR) repeat protein